MSLSNPGAESDILIGIYSGMVTKPTFRFVPSPLGESTVNLDDVSIFTTRLEGTSINSDALNVLRAAVLGKRIPCTD